MIVVAVVVSVGVMIVVTIGMIVVAVVVSVGVMIVVTIAVAVAASAHATMIAIRSSRRLEAD